MRSVSVVLMLVVSKVYFLRPGLFQGNLMRTSVRATLRYLLVSMMFLGTGLVGAAQCPAPFIVDPLPLASSEEVQISGAQVHSEGDDLVLTGNAVLSKDGRYIQAQDIRYNTVSKEVQITGAFRLRQENMEMSGDGLSITSDGVLTMSDIIVREYGSPWTLQVEELTGSIGKTKSLNIKGASATPCPLSKESWRARIGTINVSDDKPFGVVKGIALQVRRKSFFYVPGYVFPVNGDRKTGFIFPAFTNDSKSGLVLSFPFFWNIRPNLDLTVAPILSTKRGGGIATEFRHLSYQTELLVNQHQIFKDRETAASLSTPTDPVTENRDRWSRDVVFQWNLAPSWVFRTEASRVSDREYLSDFDYDLSGAQDAVTVYSYAQISHAGPERSFSVISDSYQLLQEGNGWLYRRVPSIEWSSQRQFGFAYANLDVIYTEFSSTDITRMLLSVREERDRYDPTYQELYNRNYTTVVGIPQLAPNPDTADSTDQLRTTDTSATTRDNAYEGKRYVLVPSLGLNLSGGWGYVRLEGKYTYRRYTLKQHLLHFTRTSSLRETVDAQGTLISVDGAPSSSTTTTPTYTTAKDASQVDRDIAVAEGHIDVLLNFEKRLDNGGWLNFHPRFFWLTRSHPANQNDLPLFDSGSRPVYVNDVRDSRGHIQILGGVIDRGRLRESYDQLFSTRNYFGYDRLAGDRRIVGSLTWSWQNQLGYETLEVSYATGYRKRAFRKSLRTRGELVAFNAVNNSSAVRLPPLDDIPDIIRIRSRVSEGVQFSSELQYRKQHRVRTSVDMYFHGDRNLGVYASYQNTSLDTTGYDRGREGVSIGGWFPLVGSTAVVLGATQDLNQKLNLASFGGLEYRSCCWKLRLVQNTQWDLTDSRKNTVLEFRLNHLGSIGTGSAGKLLQRWIPWLSLNE